MEYMHTLTPATPTDRQICQSHGLSGIHIPLSPIVYNFFPGRHDSLLGDAGHLCHAAAEVLAKGVDVLRRVAEVRSDSAGSGGRRR